MITTIMSMIFAGIVAVVGMAWLISKGWSILANEFGKPEDVPDPSFDREDGDGRFPL